jgi:uncharacterized protein YegP (UPF0339 family)
MLDTSNGYYVLSKNLSASQPYHWVLKAPNHQVILSSENYATKDAALNGISSARTNSPSDARYQRLTASNNSPYFNLLAANSQVIGTSEMYSSKQMMEVGIAAVKKYGKDAALQDNA